jgi:hypothetical protein
MGKDRLVTCPGTSPLAVRSLGRAALEHIENAFLDEQSAQGARLSIETIKRSTTGLNGILFPILGRESDIPTLSLNQPFQLLGFCLVESLLKVYHHLTGLDACQIKLPDPESHQDSVPTFVFVPIMRYCTFKLDHQTSSRKR